MFSVSLQTMVKYQRLQCLTHTLCSVLMDIKWYDLILLSYYTIAFFYRSGVKFRSSPALWIPDKAGVYFFPTRRQFNYVDQIAFDKNHFYEPKWPKFFVPYFFPFSVIFRRKFGLICALLNQCVYILFVLLLMIMMKKQVDSKNQVS